MKRRNKKGFTFIELMVVVAIIGILAAIAIPSFNSYIIRSRNASVKILVTEIGSLQREYRGVTGSYISCPLNPADGQAEWQDMDAWKKLGFDPQQPVYGYRFKVDAKADTFKVTALLDGKEVFSTSEKTFQVAQAE